MGKYSTGDFDKIIGTDIANYIPGAMSGKRTQFVACPQCGASGRKKGLKITHTSKINLAKCFECGFALGGVIAAVQHYQGIGKLEAIDRIAQDIGVEPVSVHRQRDFEKTKEKIKESFCARQLRESGLELSDVMVREKIEGGVREYPAFTPGSMDRYFNVTKEGDDMLIHYLTLQGYPLTYYPKAGAKAMRYNRVRWSLPDLHPDRDGKPRKYQTPKGAPARLYIPQKIRDIFEARGEIETLIIQEGEKKAEKACKHGIPSVGIQGIYNIGNEDSGLVNDLQMLIQTCKVKNVMLLFDADWNDLSRNLTPGADVSYRPRQFYGAAKKFKVYIGSLQQHGLYVDVWVAHINPNDGGDKGIDDLLTHTLAGKEESLADDLKAAMIAINGKGTWIDAFNITAWTESKLKSLWSLSQHSDFLERHSVRLKELRNFRVGKTPYKVDKEGRFVPDMGDLPEHDIWSVTYDDKENMKITFYAREALLLLKAAGYRLIQTRAMLPGEYKFVRLDADIVTDSSQLEMRRFFLGYAEQTTKASEVLNYLYKGVPSLLSNGILEGLASIDDDFDRPLPEYEFMRFANGQLRIFAHEIQFGTPVGKTWRNNVIQRRFERRPIFSRIERKSDGGWDLMTTDEGETCEYLKFLICTSCFGWRENPSEQEYTEMVAHLINKLTCIGYLLTRYKSAEQKAIVAMDGTMTESTDSKGGSGKSLFSVALSKMAEQVVVSMRNKGNDDGFLFTEVRPTTRTMVLDDLNKNFDFENLFSQITAPKMEVNIKGGARFSILREDAPKIYISTNYALKGLNDSSLRRIVFTSFSNYFTKDFTPVDQFGHQLFDGWDETQWILFDNLMAECVQLYLRGVSENWSGTGLGLVPPPMDMLERRTLRQNMGEAFLQWADVYFDDPAHCNTRISRKEMFDDFQGAYTEARFTSTTAFLSKLKDYVKYSDLHFNVNKKDKSGRTFEEFQAQGCQGTFIGEADKSNSKEFISIYNPKFLNL